MRSGRKVKCLPIPHPQGPGPPDKGLQVSLLFSPSSIKGSPPGGSPGDLGLEKGTRRRGLVRPGPSSSLLSGLEGPLDGLSPQGPPGCPRQLGPAPTRAGPCPTVDTSPGCSVSVGNREHTSEKGENREGTEELSKPGKEQGISPAVLSSSHSHLPEKPLPRPGWSAASRALLILALGSLPLGFLCCCAPSHSSLLSLRGQRLPDNTQAEGTAKARLCSTHRR